MKNEDTPRLDGQQLVDETPEVPKAGKHPKRTVRWVSTLLLVALAGGAGLIVGSRSGWVREKLGGERQTPAATAVSSGNQRKVLYWVDPMHPSYKSDKPGIAPDCGMQLTPVYEDSETVASAVPENAFKITPEKQQLIGVRYGEVTAQELKRTIRTVGRVAYDETKIARVHTKFMGYTEDVYANYVGQEVKSGDPLFTVYSPELLATEEEYLLALRAKGELAQSAYREVRDGSDSLVDAAKRRLKLWDISDAQVEEIGKTGKPIRNLTIYSPVTGVVLERKAFEKGAYVRPEDEVYKLVDLSRVWVLADVYEYEAPLIKAGQAASMTMSFAPSRVWKGKVTFINPEVNPATRTLKARLEFDNPNLTLKPEMYVNVEMTVNYGRQLAVPEDAVMDSGLEQIVYVSLPDGYFEPRKVELGEKVDHLVIVRKGLAEGEKVVTSGNFLVDSESRLRGALAGMGAMPGMSHGSGASATEKKDQPQEDHSQHQAAPKAEPVKRPPTTESRKILYWYDPMHPHYKADKPGKAPDCGMDLVPKYAGEKPSN